MTTGVHRDESEEEYKSQMENPDFHPELWKVAWDGDQMASVIHNFVDENENQEYQRKRGDTEGICTRRPWRKKGLARSAAGAEHADVQGNGHDRDRLKRGLYKTSPERCAFTKAWATERSKCRSFTGRR